MEKLKGAHAPLDEMFVALAHEDRRRLLVGLLQENPQPATPDSVDVSGETPDGKHRLIEMHHRHLPKLVEHGYVRWNREDPVVDKGPQFEEIRPLLEILDGHRDELSAGWL